MPLKHILTVGERATYRIAQQVADAYGVEVYAKIRVADALPIDRSGISNEEYSYALKAHFDVLVGQDNLPVLAIEFDGPGHDPKSDQFKNRLCDRFRLPLVRVGMAHINSKNFEDSAVHFLIHQLFCVDIFMEETNDPYEIYDPAFFVTIVGKRRSFPFDYSAHWRNRLIRPFKENAHLFGGSLRSSYEHGLIQHGAKEGAWVREHETRAICGLDVDEEKSVIGTARLAFQVFGMSDARRHNFLRLHPFVIGLAGAEMYEKALAFLDGDRSGVLTAESVQSIISGWTAEGCELRLAYQLPGH